MTAGRPSKLNKKMHESLCQSVSLGSTYQLACNAAGISYNRFNEWMKLGQIETSGKYHNLYMSIKIAEGKAVDKWLTVIDNAAEDGNWPAAAWKLERRYPGEYGKRIQQKIESVNLDVDIDSLTDDQLKRLANGENLAAVLAGKD